MIQIDKKKQAYFTLNLVTSQSIKSPQILDKKNVGTMYKYYMQIENCYDKEQHSVRTVQCYVLFFVLELHFSTENL